LPDNTPATTRTKSKARPILMLIVFALLVLLGVELRDELFHVPRVRVGPLTRDEPAPAVMRIFAVGDTGTGEAAQRRVARAMEARCATAGLPPLSAFFMLGDNVYQNGIDSVDDPEWRAKVVEPYSSPCLATAPIYPVLGNHDYKSNPGAQIEYSRIDPRWRMPNRFYTVKFGDLLRLVAFDSQTSELCFNADHCAVDFLLAQVRRRDTRWTFVTAHHPLASASEKGYGHSGGLRGLLLKPLLCDTADLWLSGHTHHMEHRLFPGCRLQAFISGGGGGDLYKVLPANGAEVPFAVSTFGFLELEVSADRVVGRFIDGEGKVLYEATRTKD
jgi:hypothetical protein